jgi:hypothetical protein
MSESQIENKRMMSRSLCTSSLIFRRYFTRTWNITRGCRYIRYQIERVIKLINTEVLIGTVPFTLIAGIPEFKNFEFFISKKENNHHKMEVDDVSMMASDALSR